MIVAGDAGLCHFFVEMCQGRDLVDLRRGTSRVIKRGGYQEVGESPIQS